MFSGVNYKGTRLMRREDAGVYALPRHHSRFHLLVRTKNLAQLPLPASVPQVAQHRLPNATATRPRHGDETVKRARSQQPRRGAARPLYNPAASPAPYRAPLLICSASQLAACWQARSRCLLRCSAVQLQHGCCQLRPRLRRQGPPAPLLFTNAQDTRG